MTALLNPKKSSEIRPVYFCMIPVVYPSHGVFHPAVARFVLFSKINFCLREVLSSQIMEPQGKKNGATSIVARVLHIYLTRTMASKTRVRAKSQPTILCASPKSKTCYNTY